VESVVRLKKTHPKMKDAVVINQGGKRYIQNSYRMPKNHFKEWGSSITKAASRPNSEFEYMPTQTGYVEKGGCGGSNDGHAVVHVL